MLVGTVNTTFTSFTVLVIVVRNPMLTEFVTAMQRNFRSRTWRQWSKPALAGLVLALLSSNQTQVARFAGCGIYGPPSVTRSRRLGGGTFPAAALVFGLLSCS